LEDIYSIKPFGSGIIQDASFEEEGQTVGLVLMVYVCRLGNKDQKITLDAGHLEYKWCSPQEAAADLLGPLAGFADPQRPQLVE